MSNKIKIDLSGATKKEELREEYEPVFAEIYKRFKEIEATFDLFYGYLRDLKIDTSRLLASNIAFAKTFCKTDALVKRYEAEYMLACEFINQLNGAASEETSFEAQEFSEE